MHITRIELINFGRFKGEHDLDLTGKDVIGVAGPNRAGKSSLIVDTFTYVFFDYVRRTVRDIVTRGESEMLAVYTLSNGARIERGWNGKGHVQLSGWEGANSSDSNAAIRKLLGVTREDYFTTQLFAQGDTARFASARPAERKKLVESWVARPVWRRASTIAVEELNAAKKEVQRLDSVLSALEGDEGDEETETPASLAKQIKKLTAQLRKSEKELEAQPEDPSKPEPPKKLTDTRAAVVIAQQAERVARKNLRRFDGECPVTGVGCPVAKNISKDTEVRAERLEEAKRRLASARKMQDALNEDLRELVDGWRMECEGNAEVAGEIEDVCDTLREEIAALNTRHAVVKERADVAKRKAKAIKKARRELNKARAGLASLQYCARMFGRDGIPADEIRDAMDEAEDVANHVVLDALGVPYRVQFRHGKELRKWADACMCGSDERVRDLCIGCGKSWPKARDDKLEVMVEDDGQVFEFSEESGGCKDVVSMALRFAFARTLGALKVATCDEVFRHMDRTVRGRVASFLCGGKFRALGYDQVLVLSHDDRLLSAAPHLLRVERHGDESRFRWER